jgi:hypothetical protein
MLDYAPGKAACEGCRRGDSNGHDSVIHEEGQRHDQAAQDEEKQQIGDKIGNRAQQQSGKKRYSLLLLSAVHNIAHADRTKKHACK